MTWTHYKLKTAEHWIAIMQELSRRRTPEEVETRRAREPVESKRSTLEETESRMNRVQVERVERYAVWMVCLLPDFCSRNH
jgi:hypothetical protein